MGKRLNEERQRILGPTRYERTLKEIESLGYICYPMTNKSFRFMHLDDCWITYYPYSGWATGKTIKDGRGFKNLYNQIKEDAPNILKPIE